MRSCCSAVISIIIIMRAFTCAQSVVIVNQSHRQHGKGIDGIMGYFER